MRRWIIHICLAILLTAYTYRYNEIVWSTTEKLEWEDFVSVPENQNFAALTASGIYFSYTENLTSFEIETYAVFDKDESWVNTERATDRLLHHEQLHFDITELWARKMKQEISETDFVNAEVLNAIYEKNVQGLIEMQKMYDQESHHSLRKRSQKRWENKISVSLQKLDFYEPTHFIVAKGVVAVESYYNR